MAQPSGNEKDAKKRLRDNASCTHNVARFELEVTCGKSWELSTTLYEYNEKWMTHHTPDKEIKKRILNHNPPPSNMKTAHITSWRCP